MGRSPLAPLAAARVARLCPGFGCRCGLGFRQVSDSAGEARLRRDLLPRGPRPGPTVLRAVRGMHPAPTCVHSPGSGAISGTVGPASSSKPARPGPLSSGTRTGGVRHNGAPGDKRSRQVGRGPSETRSLDVDRDPPRPGRWSASGRLSAGQGLHRPIERRRPRHESRRCVLRHDRWIHSACHRAGRFRAAAPWIRRGPSQRPGPWCGDGPRRLCGRCPCRFCAPRPAPERDGELRQAASRGAG
jgi:hypothetical protein